MSTRTREHSARALFDKVRDDVAARHRDSAREIDWEMLVDEEHTIACDLELTAQLFTHAILANVSLAPTKVSLEVTEDALRLVMARGDEDRSSDSNHSAAMLNLHRLLRDELIALLEARHTDLNEGAKRAVLEVPSP